MDPIANRLLALFSLVVVVSACSSAGTNGSGGARAGGGGAGGAANDMSSLPPVGSIVPGDTGDPSATGPLALRRLTNDEYDATVKDMLGDETRPARMFPGNVSTSFGFVGAGPADVTQTRAFAEAAEALAAKGLETLARLYPCQAGNAQAETNCGRAFVEKAGKRLFRRPLTPVELADYGGLYEQARKDLSLGHVEAERLILSALLQSPQFLYLWQDGRREAKEQVRLDDYTLASRLSYFLWGSAPDDELMKAADDAKLGDVQERERQARRMLKDERAKPRLAAFIEEWLLVNRLFDTSKSPEIYPTYSADTAKAMAAETRALVANVVVAGDGKLSTLLSTRKAWIDETTAGLYGVSAGSAAQAIDLMEGQRAGILTRLAFLSASGATNGSHPVKRGKVIFTRVLCRDVGVPPAEIPDVAPPRPGVTTRQRFAEHGANPGCRGCHEQLDPLGFAFEHYDGIGKRRDTDNGQAVDASGTVQLDGIDHAFANGVELSRLLGESSEVKDCLVRQAFRFMQHRLESAVDLNSLGSSLGSFLEASGDVRELFVALARSRAFAYRTATPGDL
ncbi:MAG: DUF1592 domain-containing protein [Deltaproteobacteria bacterium]|nr:DUF1592 domain-containing protein [Deltaproteobacteria bacterium]